MALSTSIPRLFAAGALGALALSIGAPAAVADDTIVCEPGQVVVAGQCHVPSDVNNDHSGNPGGTTTTGGHSSPGSHSH
ncbi:hypothetical protein [Mycolicibacterium sp. lyk4-40-TYG-92]|uniref:hypothetical protein n=1 Tax=Mycolicibacterium sp. lyk4-40-TYG-92 TaxID=3040295 RepID=UPI00254C19D6|nr:hypothetical protein [Mycolicibacterium sp. lyk4-40-TYG-92]